MAAKILTLEETVQWGRGPIWVQENGIRFAQCVLYDLENVPFLRFKVCTTYKSDRHLKYRGREYGKSWRCFDRKPGTYDLMQPFEEGQP
jgi:hypothetical protein